MANRFLNLVITLGTASICLIIGMALFAPQQITLPDCDDRLTQDSLEESLALGTEFLLKNQHQAGNFAYEYDWRRKSFNPKDSQVRQAGATWGLALINQFRPAPKLKAATLRAVGFMNDHSQVNKAGGRFVLYPGEPSGKLGTVALTALAHIELLRSPNIQPQEAKDLKEFLDGYMRFLRSALNEHQLFHSKYDLKGTPFGPSSSYFDGEALLALVKGARYLSYPQDDLLDIADAGFEQNIRQALWKDPDSDVTKGYFQWSSMAFYEIATSDWPNSRRFNNRVVRLANWMIDVHHTLNRRRNTAYAYEGIIHALDLAYRHGDSKHARKFACVTEYGLAKLTSWQVGHSLANKFLKGKGLDDPKARGGVQNHPKEPQLRIDVTQHQMAAVILALQYYTPRKP